VGGTRTHNLRLIRQARVRVDSVIELRKRLLALRNAFHRLDTAFEPIGVWGGTTVTEPRRAKHAGRNGDAMLQYRDTRTVILERTAAELEASFGRRLRAWKRGAAEDTAKRVVLRDLSARQVQVSRGPVRRPALRGDTSSTPPGVRLRRLSAR
jgi:hypothetical protein